jgi:hypothetical protein
MEDNGGPCCMNAKGKTHYTLSHTIHHNEWDVTPYNRQSIFSCTNCIYRAHWSFNVFQTRVCTKKYHKHTHNALITWTWTNSKVKQHHNSRMWHHRGLFFFSFFFAKPTRKKTMMLLVYANKWYFYGLHHPIHFIISFNGHWIAPHMQRHKRRDLSPNLFVILL